MAKPSNLCPPLGLLVLIAETLGAEDMAKLTPIYRAFCRLDYRDRQKIQAQVRRLQAAAPDLSEGDCLELLAKIAPFLRR